MDYRQLGNTDFKVGCLGVGCMTFGWRVDAREADALVAAALDIGVNLFDTSVSYGRGVSETLLGEALRKSGRRHEALIATKFGQAATHDANPHDVGNGLRVLTAHCELSLRRLRTDRIDLLQIHNFSAAVPLEETLGGLDRLVRDGKVRYIGCSNFTGSQLTDAVGIADARHFCPIHSHQARFNLLDRRAETDVMLAARLHGVGNIAYGPLAEGLLTGKYRAGKAFPAGSRFAAASPTNNYGARLTPAVAATITRLEAAAASHSLSLWRLALAWVLANPTVACALVGPSSVAQVESLREVANLRLAPEVMELVDEINPAGASIPG